MITFDLFQFAAVAFMACGLLAVVLEIVLKDAGGLLEMMDDVRHFAERRKDATPAWHPKSAAPHQPRLSS
jgi:hypothetical protein